jgi:hypothetical protein
MTQEDGLERFGIPSDCDPKIESIVRYWISISPEGSLPGRQHFDPTDIPRMLQDVWLIDVDREPLEFSFRLVGTGVAAYFGSDPTGRKLEDVFDNFEDTLAYKDFRDVVTKRERRWRRGQPMLAPGSKIERLERVYLPMARNGRDVDMILCYTVFDY